jgi:hypothetical protein
VDVRALDIRLVIVVWVSDEGVRLDDGIGDQRSSNISGEIACREEGTTVQAGAEGLLLFASAANGACIRISAFIPTVCDFDRARCAAAIRVGEVKRRRPHVCSLVMALLLYHSSVWKMLVIAQSDATRDWRERSIEAAWPPALGVDLVAALAGCGLEFAGTAVATGFVGSAALDAGLNVAVAFWAEVDKWDRSDWSDMCWDCRTIRDSVVRKGQGIV